jgi:hypothetical protein
MPIVAGDIDFFLSGGGSNTDPNAALGGAISTTTQITDATVANLFDNVSSAESSAGDTEYRCFYVKNSHGSLSLQNAVVYINSNTPSSDTSVEIALGTSAVNGTEQTIANESTAPTGTSFSTAAGSGNALSIGNIPAGQHKAIWVKRIVGSSAAAYNADNVVIRVAGDTAA